MMDTSTPGSKRPSVRYKQAKSILTKPSGFIGAYDYTLNPYSGCAFGCTYCYAAFFAPLSGLQENWGQWLEVKENALELLKKQRHKPLIDKTIYMSSVTDPYQPIEKSLLLTRSLLEELLSHHRVRLVVQTRGPLVTRDTDLLRQFAAVQVNMTITTDDEAVRRVFEPTCPANTQRLAAITEINAAGIPACITMTPLLPVRSPEAFAETLLATGVQKFVIQAFHAGSSRFAAGTGSAAVKLAQQMQWDKQRYREVVTFLQNQLPELREGQDGFAPIPPSPMPIMGPSDA